MGMLDFLKKKEKGSLPPPPPPGKGDLPPLPSMELDIPPTPTMPVPPKPVAMPYLPPIPESLAPTAPVEKPMAPPPMPKLKSERPAIPIVKALPEPREVEEKYVYKPTIVQDRTVQKPKPRVPMRKVAHAPQEAHEIAVPQVRTAPRIVRKAPEELFISVGDYQDMMESMDRVQAAIEDSEQLITRLHELKTSEEEVLEEWKTHLEDVEKKLSYVDQVIFEGE